MAALAAGSTFAGAALAGLVGGIAIDRASHHSFYAVAGLFIGIALGGYGAVRLLVRAMN